MLSGRGGEGASGRAVLAGLLMASGAFASATTAWEMTSYADFIRGQFQGISLSRDGRLMLAPKVDTLFSSGQAVVWSVAEGANGVIYVATGHRGRVYQVDPSGASSLLWTAEQPEVFAIATDRNGILYAGTSPDGKVYRIEKGKATEYFAPKTRYIWSLAAAPDGALYVGTGDQGKIYRVTSAGSGELYYDTGQSHVTGLAMDIQGRLLAGTEPNGILYRVSAKDKAFVLYDASLPEIRAIIPSRMEPCTQPRWAAPWPSARRPPRRPLSPDWAQSTYKARRKPLPSKRRTLSPAPKSKRRATPPS
jgi:WD40 repeat protein